MRHLLLALFLFGCSIHLPANAQEQKKTASGHYLIAWTGDAANKRAGCSANGGAEGREGWGNDFLAVIDADPASRSYGHLMTTVVTDQQTMYVHHTEYTMPASGMLLKLDQATGALTMDDSFHDADGKPGFNFADRDWPHGWKGSGLPHGVVFSR